MENSRHSNTEKTSKMKLTEKDLKEGAEMLKDHLDKAYNPPKLLKSWKKKGLFSVSSSSKKSKR